MKNYSIWSLLLIAVVICSACEKSSESTSSTTTNNNTIHSQSFIRIEVMNVNGLPQSGIHVIMSDSLITYTRPFTSIESSISDANGIALFDMKKYESLMPKTFYFGALRQEGGAFILMGTRQIENVLKGIEYKGNLILLH